MRTFHWFGRLAGLATPAVLIAACAAASGGSPTPSSDPETAAAPAPPILFTVTATCRESNASAPSDVPKPHPDALWGVCDQTATDPRLSGRSEGYVLFQGDPDADWELSSTTTVENDGGSWACKDFGRGRDTLAVVDGVCVGEGAYAGLTAYSHGVSDNRTATNGSFGWIIESQ
jgi:hypothetical protein